MQTIQLGDTLTFAFAKEDKLTCSDTTLPSDSSNLVLKAVNLFRRKSGLHFSVEIHLDKKIPTQAGLGGGSSNAATTLWALNALHHFPYSDEELCRWSSEIGSDIPFFFSLGSAYCTGRGEKLRNLPPLDLPSFAIEKPNEGLSTPTIFKALNLSECSKEDPEALLDAFYSGKPRYINDVEGTAARLCPALIPFRQELLKKYIQVFMTGTGSAHVCLGEGKIPAVYRKQREWFKKVF